MKFLILLFLMNSEGKIIRDEKILPKFLTEEEKLKTHEIGTYLLKGPPPSFPVRTSAEYERVQCVFFRWPYSSSWNSIWREMIREVCEVTKAYIITAYPSDTTSIKNYLQAGGVNIDSVRFLITTTNSVWIRDYGPWSIYVENGSLSIIDFIYNRPRPQDDSFPSKLGQMWNIPVYLPNLVHAGGNFMVDGNGVGFATELIYQENNLTPSQIAQIMKDYCGIEKFVVVPRIFYEYTGHIDIFAKILNDTLVMVGKYDNPNDPNYARLNQIADSISHVQNLDGKYFKVIRIIMPESFTPSHTTGATYLNSLFVNGKILVPIYGLPQDPEALQVYQQALPDYEVIGINCANMVGSGGAIHCVTMGFSPKDLEPPQIIHTPLNDTSISYWPLTCYAEVFDNLKVYRVYLIYNINHLDSNMVRMFKMEETDTFYAEFQGNVNVGDSIFYRILAIDGAFNKKYLPLNGYFAFKIKEETKISERKKEIPFKIYFEGKNLIILSNEENLIFEIYDISGRKTEKILIGKGIKKINFKNLKYGTYFINLKSKNYNERFKILNLKGVKK